MANPYKRQYNVNGAHRDGETNRYQGSLSHNSLSHPIHTDSKYVNPLHLVNNGPAVQYHVPAEHRPAQSVQVVVPSPYRESRTTTEKYAPPVGGFAATSATPPLDYQILLLSLAEDYFAAAHGAGSLLALARRQSDVLEYQRLIATGLSCLEASLKYWRLQPLLEARILLRYASILHEETDNLDDAEEALSKGVVICERLRDFDLKYNIQHLLTRILYRSNVRAGLKYLDRLIDDVEAYQHVAWVYAFRFLRVSLSLECSSHQEVTLVLSNLRSIYATTQKYGDAAVGAIAMVLEATIHLREPDSAESTEQAQRAIALVRRSQLDPDVGSTPKLIAMTHFVDLCCILRRFDPTQAMTKMQAMQAILEALRDVPSQADNGSFRIPIHHTKGMNQQSNGAVRSGQDGAQALVFDWLPDRDVYGLGFLLSAVCVAHKNATDGQKAESMLHEGIRLQMRHVDEAVTMPQSVSIATSRQSWRLQLKAFMHLHLAFVLCIRTAWSLAEEQLRHVKATISALSLRSQDDLSLSAQYLEGVIQQAAGNLDAALGIFQGSALAIAQVSKSTASQLQADLSIVSALNTLLIIRSRPQNFDAISPLLQILEPLCATNPNKSLVTAYNLVIATVSDSESIVRTKQCLQYALQVAKACGNKQLLCMTLNFLSWKFFRGVVGEQAEKSAKTSHITAKMAMDRLWMSVSAGLLGDTLEIQGRIKEAEAMKEEGRTIAAGLPAAVQVVESG